MPLYDYQCASCEARFEAQRLIDQRAQAPCDCGGVGDLIVSAPLIAGEVIKGDRRIIVDERQVSSEKGLRWRDEGTTGREGGAGRRIMI